MKCMEANKEGRYCCPGDDNCSCDTGVGALMLGASQPTTVMVIGSTSWPGYVSTASQFSTSAFALDGTTTQTGSMSTLTQGASTVTRTGTSTAKTTLGTTLSGTEGAASAGSTGSTIGIIAASKSSTNTGAIASGVVGGMVVLALIGGLGWFLGRRHSRKKIENAGSKKSYAPEMVAG